MKRITRLLTLALAACILAAAIPTTGLSAEVDQQVGYSARAILPENQLEGVTGYFKLLTPSESSQIIEVEVSNHLAEPARISVAVTNAGTSPNGMITYAGTEQPGGAPLLNLKDLVSLRNDLLMVGPEEAIIALEGSEIILAPNVTVRLPFEVTVPHEKLLGQVLGGIVLIRLPMEEESTEASTMAIHSQYSYAIAVQLQAEEQQRNAPSFSLHGAVMTAVAGLDALQVNLHNDAPLVITGASLQVQVFAAGEATPAFEVSKDRIAMAPGSSMPFTSVLPDDLKLEPGEYTVKTEIVFDGEVWSENTTLSVANKGA